ncbi:MAG: TIGR00268 family protein, partial [Lawsonibacter sp.]|nr:TIGR00268 family protein [Lawsonibacter sp.]
MTLQEFFIGHPRAALAFSGGTDSAFLLRAARDCGCRVRAYCVSSPFQPRFELEDARRLA